VEALTSTYTLISSELNPENLEDFELFMVAGQFLAEIKDSLSLATSGIEFLTRLAAARSSWIYQPELRLALSEFRILGDPIIDDLVHSLNQVISREDSNVSKSRVNLLDVFMREKLPEAVQRVRN
jgi:hypothetical protein